MGKHKEWRKIAKKLRRKRIRSKLAQERDELLKIEEAQQQSCPRYQAWLKEQEILESFQQEEEERQHKERNKQWIKDEEVAQAAWREKQLRAALAQQEKEKQIFLLKEKLKEEEKIKQEELDKKQQEREIAQLNQERLKKTIADFMDGTVNELPIEIRQTSESQPGKAECPFFSKVGACRFFDRCSRNHVRPGLSKVLLFQGLYSHFSLMSHTSRSQEYDTDISLEFDNFDTYKHFDEFFRDVVGEIKKLGKVTLVKVCKNSEQHLRGNVYVQFRTERDALRVYSSLYGRYYAGKQLTPTFVNIPSWKNALCGQQWSKNCHKGSLCNFLHVFSNPNGELSRYYDILSDDDSDSPKNNRWSSDSPEERKEGRKDQRLHSRRSHERNRSADRSRRRESSRRNESGYPIKRRDSGCKKSSNSDRRSSYGSDRRRNGHFRKHGSERDKRSSTQSKDSRWPGESNAPEWSSDDEDIKKNETRECKKRSRKRKKKSKHSDVD